MSALFICAAESDWVVKFVVSNSLFIENERESKREIFYVLIFVQSFDAPLSFMFSRELRFSVF
jgi:hypothetical protein